MVFELCSKGSEGVTQLLKNEETEIDLHFRLLVEKNIYYSHRVELSYLKV